MSYLRELVLKVPKGAYYCNVSIMKYKDDDDDFRVRG